ncbi:MAG: outer membrane protein TolC [Myxococcota bacterium]|jgi:outer membrane protein TolC
MWWTLLLLSAHGMTLADAVQAGVARAPAMDAAEAGVAEARAALGEVRGHLLPSASLNAALIGQTEIEVDLFGQLTLPFPLPDSPDPLVIVPGTQVMGGALVNAPLIAPAAWAGGRAAKEAVGLAESRVAADAQSLTAGIVAAFHGAAQARAVLAQAERVEALAARLLDRGRTLQELGAIAEDEVLPFARAHATARANVAMAREGVGSAEGVLHQLTGLTGPAELAPVPTAVPDLEGLLASVDRADLRAASRGAETLGRRIQVAQAARYPTVGLQGAVNAVTPAPALGKELTWRVSLGATVPLFQGGVSGQVGQARAQVARAEAASRMAREQAELQVRRSHGALSQAVAALGLQDEALALARATVTAAEARLTEGGGSLFQLQQAQLELVAAEGARTAAGINASRASAELDLAARGTPER